VAVVAVQGPLAQQTKLAVLAVVAVATGL